MHKKLIFLIVVSVLLSSNILAEKMNIISPYFGFVSYSRQDDSINETDNSLMEGLFYQTFDSDKYLWNFFAYNSEDLLYSSVNGVNTVFDYYFGKSNSGKNVIGAGFNYINIDLDAGNNLGPDDLKMDNSVFSPYIRLGRYINLKTGSFMFSFLPWIGYEADITRGSIFVDPPSPAPPTVTTKESIDSEDYFALAGLNIKLVYNHFLDIKLKYSGVFNEDDYYSRTSLIANISLSRKWGLSYRFKYDESAESELYYQLIGAFVVF